MTVCDAMAMLEEVSLRLACVRKPSEQRAVFAVRKAVQELADIDRDMIEHPDQDKCLSCTVTERKP
jgi:hypothetical protein